MGPILQRICGETEPRVYSEGRGGVRPQLLSLNIEVDLRGIGVKRRVYANLISRRHFVTGQRVALARRA